MSIQLFRTADGRTIRISENYFHSTTSDGRTCCATHPTAVCRGCFESLRGAKARSQQDGRVPPPQSLAVKLRAARGLTPSEPAPRVAQGRGVPPPPSIAEKLKAARR
jgi:hypothetical protein